MSASMTRGGIAIPERPALGRVSTVEEQDRAVDELVAAKDRWARRTLSERIEVLDRLMRAMAAVSPDWVAAECAEKGYVPGSPESGAEWFGGPVFVLRTARLLRNTLRDLERGAQPAHGPVRLLTDGQVAVRVFPTDAYDRILYAGYDSEVWLDRSVGSTRISATVARAYRNGSSRGEVCLVLGGGNLSAIQPADVLHQLFAENRSVVLKCSPVQEHLGPLLEEVFAPLIDADALRVVYGGAQVAQRLAHLPGVDRVHMTGSDKTYDALMWGTDAEAEGRRRENRPRLAKPFTAELAQVSPVIVVPGPWSPNDLRYQGESVASMTLFNAGHICVSARVLLTQSTWPQRHGLLDAVRSALREAPALPAYYPGSAERHVSVLDAYPHAERCGEPSGAFLPPLLIPHVPADATEPALSTDPFCSVLAEVPLDADDPAQFLDQAVQVCNDRIWGSLGVVILVHPRTRREPATAAALARALKRLRYGTIVVNAGAGLPYAMVSPPWGAYPGNDPRDIGSGTGFVHNTYLLGDIEKAVTHGPWRVRPKPAWFPSHRRPHQVMRRLAALEADPDPRKLPSLLQAALRG